MLQVSLPCKDGKQGTSGVQLNRAVCVQPRTKGRKLKESNLDEELKQKIFAK